MFAATKNSRQVAEVAVPAGDGADPPAAFVPAQDVENSAPPADRKRGALLRAAVAVAVAVLLLLIIWMPAGGEGDRGPELLEATHGDDDDATLRLIAAGADVNFRAAGNRGGMTPLHVASRDGRVEVVEALLAHGADVDVRDKDGRTPLALASIWGRVDAVEALLVHGADPNLEDEWGQTSLYLASMQGHADVVELLKGAGGA